MAVFDTGIHVNTDLDFQRAIPIFGEINLMEIESVTIVTGVNSGGRVGK